MPMFSRTRRPFSVAVVCITLFVAAACVPCANAFEFASLLPVSNHVGATLVNISTTPAQAASELATVVFNVSAHRLITGAPAASFSASVLLSLRTYDATVAALASVDGIRATLNQSRLLSLEPTIDPLPMGPAAAIHHIGAVPAAAALRKETATSIAGMLVLSVALLLMFFSVAAFILVVIRKQPEQAQEETEGAKKELVDCTPQQVNTKEASEDATAGKKDDSDSLPRPRDMVSGLVRIRTHSGHYATANVMSMSVTQETENLCDDKTSTQFFLLHRLGHGWMRLFAVHNGAVTGLCVAGTGHCLELQDIAANIRRAQCHFVRASDVHDDMTVNFVWMSKPNLVFDVTACSELAGAKMVVFEYNGGSSQRFRLERAPDDSPLHACVAAALTPDPGSTVAAVVRTASGGDDDMVREAARLGVPGAMLGGFTVRDTASGAVLTTNVPPSYDRTRLTSVQLEEHRGSRSQQFYIVSSAVWPGALQLVSRQSGFSLGVSNDCTALVPTLPCEKWRYYDVSMRQRHDGDVSKAPKPAPTELVPALIPIRRDGSGRVVFRIVLPSMAYAALETGVGCEHGSIRFRQRSDHCEDEANALEVILEPVEGTAHHDASAPLTREVEASGWLTLQFVYSGCMNAACVPKVADVRLRDAQMNFDCVKEGSYRVILRNGKVLELLPNANPGEAWRTTWEEKPTQYWRLMATIFGCEDEVCLVPLAAAQVAVAQCTFSSDPKAKLVCGIGAATGDGTSRCRLIPYTPRMNDSLLRGRFTLQYADDPRLVLAMGEPISGSSQPNAETGAPVTTSGGPAGELLETTPGPPLKLILAAEPMEPRTVFTLRKVDQLVITNRTTFHLMVMTAGATAGESQCWIVSRFGCVLRFVVDDDNSRKDPATWFVLTGSSPLVTDPRSREVWSNVKTATRNTGTPLLTAVNVAKPTEFKEFVCFPPPPCDGTSEGSPVADEVEARITAHSGQPRVVDGVAALTRLPGGPTAGFYLRTLELAEYLYDDFSAEVVSPAPPDLAHDSERIAEETQLAAVQLASRPSRVLRDVGSLVIAMLCIVLAAIGIALAIDGGAPSALPAAMVHEYSGPRCNTSLFAPLPVRAAVIPADGSCRRVSTDGFSSAVYAAAICDAGRVLTRSGPTLSACDTSSFRSAAVGECVLGTLLMEQSTSALEPEFSTMACVAEESVPALRASPPVYDTIVSTTQGVRLRPTAAAVELDESTTIRTSTAAGALSLRQAPTRLSMTLHSDLLVNRSASLGGFAESIVLPDVRDTAADVGAQDRFTVSAWVQLDRNSRGFVVAVAHDWRVSAGAANGTLPILEALRSVIVGSAVMSPFSSSPLAAFFALYVDGAAGRIVVASAADGSVEQMVWDFAQLRMLLFDGRPHRVSVRTATKKHSGRFLLFIDGYASDRAPGWQQCFSRRDFPAIYDLGVNVATPTRDAAVSTIARPAAVVVGAGMVGAVGDVTFERGMTPARDLRAAAHMSDDSVSEVASYTVGSLMALIAVIGAAVAVVQVLRDADQELHVNVGKAAAKGGSRVSFRGSSTANSASSSTGPLFKAVVLDALTAAQMIDIYFTGWEWPALFQVPMEVIIFLPSFDLSLDLFRLSPLVSPLLQLTVALTVVVVGLRILQADAARFRARLPRMMREAREGSSLPEDPTAVPLPSGACPVELLYEGTVQYKGRDAKVLSTDDVLNVAAVMQLEVQKTPAIESLLARGECPSYGDSALEPSLHRGGFQGRFGRDAETGALTHRHDDDGDGVVVVAHRRVTHCPMHPEARLIHALDGEHRQQMAESRAQGRQPSFECAHAAMPFHLDRPKPCDMELGFYVCPECSFSICHSCAEIPGRQKLLALLATKAFEWRDPSLLVGAIVVGMVEAVYVPILKNATMIVTCHRTFQCVFPKCYEEPTGAFVAAVTLSAAMIVIVGLAVPGVIFGLLVERKRLIVEHIFGENTGEMSTLDVLRYTTTEEEWVHVLKYDSSVLKGVYAVFELRYTWVQPVLLLTKLVLVVGVVSADPESLWQLGVSCAVQAALLVFMVGTQPFVDEQIDHLSKAGGLHQVVLLCLMAFYRAARNLPVAVLMLVTSAVYTTFLAIVIVQVVRAIRAAKLAARVRLGPHIAVRLLDTEVLRVLAETEPERLLAKDSGGKPVVQVGAELTDFDQAERMVALLLDLIPEAEYGAVADSLSVKPAEHEDSETAPTVLTHMGKRGMQAFLVLLPHAQELVVPGVVTELASNGRVDFLQVVYARDPKLLWLGPTDGIKPAAAAAKAGQAEALKWIIEHADIDSLSKGEATEWTFVPPDGSEPVSLREDPFIVERLQSRDESVAAAAEQLLSKTLALLVAADGKNMMHYAAMSNDTATCNVVWEAVNGWPAVACIVDSYNGHTPLECAAAANAVETMRWLVSHGHTPLQLRSKLFDACTEDADSGNALEYCLSAFDYARCCAICTFEDGDNAAELAAERKAKRCLDVLLSDAIQTRFFTGFDAGNRLVGMVVPSTVARSQVAAVRWTLPCVWRNDCLPTWGACIGYIDLPKALCDDLRVMVFNFRWRAADGDADPDDSEADTSWVNFTMQSVMRLTDECLPATVDTHFKCTALPQMAQRLDVVLKSEGTSHLGTLHSDSSRCRLVLYMRCTSRANQSAIIHGGHVTFYTHEGYTDAFGGKPVSTSEVTSDTPMAFDASAVTEVRLPTIPACAVPQSVATGDMAESAIFWGGPPLLPAVFLRTDATRQPVHQGQPVERRAGFGGTHRDEWVPMDSDLEELQRTVLANDVAGTMQLVARHHGLAALRALPYGHGMAFWASQANSRQLIDLAYFYGADKDARDHDDRAPSYYVSLKARNTGVSAPGGSNVTASCNTVPPSHPDEVPGAMQNVELCAEALSHNDGLQRLVAAWRSGFVSKADEGAAFLAMWGFQRRLAAAAQLPLEDSQGLPLRETMKLVVACIDAGWVSGVRAMLTVIGRGPHQGTVMWRHACQNGDVTMMQVLLEAGVRYFRVSPQDQQTLAHYAATEHVLRFFDSARMNVGDVTTKDAKNRTAAHILASSDVSAAALPMLEERGVDLSAEDAEGLAPIHLAAKADAHASVRMLIKLGHGEVTAGHAKFKTALHIAVTSSATKAVEVLCQAFPESVWTRDGDEALPIMLAVQKYDDGKIALPLVQHTQRHVEASLRNEIAHREHTADALFSARTGGKGLLHLIRVNDERVLSTIIGFAEHASGKPLDALSEDGLSPIGLAVERSIEPYLRLLLAAGADPNIKSKGSLPLFSALALGAANEIVEPLLELTESSIDAFANDEQQATLLHAAANHSRVQHVVRLLERGFDPNARNVRGETPLHKAVTADNGAAVTALAPRTAHTIRASMPHDLAGKELKGKDTDEDDASLVAYAVRAANKSCLRLVVTHASRDDLAEAIERNVRAAKKTWACIGIALEQLLALDPVATSPSGEPVAASILAAFTLPTENAERSSNSKDRAAGIRAVVDAVLSPKLEPSLESPWFRPALDGTSLFELIAASGAAEDMAQAVRLVPYTARTASMFSRGLSMLDVAVVCLAGSLIPAEARQLLDAAIEHEVTLASARPTASPTAGNVESDVCARALTASKFEMAPYASAADAMSALMGSKLPDAEALALKLWDATTPLPEQADLQAVVAGEPLLFRALGLGRPRVAARLLDQGALVLATQDGRTAAHRAVAGGCFSLLRRLHDAGVALHNSDEASLVDDQGVPQPLACAISANAARTAHIAILKFVPTMELTWEVLSSHTFTGDAAYSKELR